MDLVFFSDLFTRAPFYLTLLKCKATQRICPFNQSATSHTSTYFIPRSPVTSMRKSHANDLDGFFDGIHVWAFGEV